MADGRTIVVVPDTAALAEEAARRFVAQAQAALAEHALFRVALAGGSTPRAMYAALARPPLRDQFDWARVQIFWSDERFVALDDPESNYRAARDLLDAVPIPAANVFPVPTVGSAPEQAALAYAATIRAQVGDDLPRFDLILLGMGPDGHTASLFPGAPEVVAPSAALVVAVHNAPKPPPDRLSFTFALINAARQVLVLVAGADKAETLRAVLNGAPDPARLPAQQVAPSNGPLVWLVEQAAAQLLDQRGS